MTTAPPTGTDQPRSGVALRARGLTRTFASPAGDVHACVDVDLEVRAGELLVVRGASGAGKTTLLNLLGVLDIPSSGSVWIGDTDTTGLGEDALAQLRRENLGFVFQSFGLIPVLSAAENVELPLRIAKTDPAERTERVAAALALVGLDAHAAQRPAELSGGQQQRVGIARAIVTRPRILIADEPTGQLDSRTAATVMELIGGLVRTQGLAAIVSTHDPLLVQRADRVVELHDGRITSDTGDAAADLRDSVGPVGVSPAESGKSSAGDRRADDRRPLTRAQARTARGDED